MRRRLRDRLGGWFLGVALIVVVGWPLVALVLETTNSLRRLEHTADRWGWTGAAAALHRWNGPDLALSSAGLIDPALTGGAARPLSLALETMRVVLATEAIAIPIGVALAMLVFRTDLWGRRVLLGILALGLFVPLPLHTMAWLGAVGNLGRSQLIGTRPLLTGWPAAAFIHAMAALPWVVLLAGVGLRTVEPELEESALLDLSGWRVAIGVTLRRSIGAIAAAALAVAVLTAGDMTVTDMLQVRTFAEEVFLQAQLGGGPAAARVALPPFLVLVPLIVLAARALLRLDPARLASAASRARTWRLGAWRRPLGRLVLGVTGTVLAIPLVGLVWRAGRVAGRADRGKPPHWSLDGLIGTLKLAWPDVVEPSALTNDPLHSPFLATVLYGAIGATFAVALAWALAWKGRRPGVWRWAAALTVALILAAPGPIAGLALKVAYLHHPLIHDTPAIVVLSFTLRTLPYALILLWPVLRALPREPFDAAEIDGYGPWNRIAWVALPLSRGAVVAAWCVAFVLAIAELPATNVVLPPGVPAISVRLWELMHNGVEIRLAGVVLILVGLFAVASFLASSTLTRVWPESS